MKRAISFLIRGIALWQKNRRKPRRSVRQRLLPAFVATCLLFGLSATGLQAQRVESQKEKTVTIRGVQMKKDTPYIGGNYHYQMELLNITNETMVVDVEVAFSNDEISETFEDSIHIDPGQTVNRDWITKVHGTRNNTIVGVGMKKLRVRSQREVGEENRSQAERQDRQFAQKAAADYARQQKAAEEWQKQMRELAEGNRRAVQARVKNTAVEPVHFDIELIKLLLLDMDGVKPRPDLDRFSKTAQNHHWSVLMDAGLVDGAAIKNSDGTVNSVMLKKLTPPGRAFLAVIRDETVWKQIAEKAGAEGDKMTATRLKEIVDAVSSPAK